MWGSLSLAARLTLELPTVKAYSITRACVRLHVIQGLHAWLAVLGVPKCLLMSSVGK